MDLSYPLMEWGRHRKAAEAAQQPPTATDLEALGESGVALVVTFKRSGEPVPTPVVCALAEDGKAYFRTEPHMAKVKRIENDSRVLIGPCNFRGKPRGPLAEARAHVLSEPESEFAHTVLKQSWTPAFRPSEMAIDGLRVPLVYVEVSATAAAAPPHQDRSPR